MLRCRGMMSNSGPVLASLWLLIAVLDPRCTAVLAAQDVKGGEASRRPSILLVMPDQMRGQDMGCMGNAEVQTPSLDRLASQGLLFRNSFANTPVCCPARAIILTGRYAHMNGVVANDLRLRESADDPGGDPWRSRLRDRIHREMAPRWRQATARLHPAGAEAAGFHLLGGERVRPLALPPRLLPGHRSPHRRGPVRARGVDGSGHRVPASSW